MLIVIHRIFFLLLFFFFKLKFRWINLYNHLNRISLTRYSISNETCGSITFGALAGNYKLPVWKSTFGQSIFGVFVALQN